MPPFSVSFFFESFCADLPLTPSASTHRPLPIFPTASLFYPLPISLPALLPLAHYLRSIRRPLSYLISSESLHPLRENPHLLVARRTQSSKHIWVTSPFSFSFLSIYQLKCSSRQYRGRPPIYIPSFSFVLSGLSAISSAVTTSTF